MRVDTTHWTSAQKKLWNSLSPQQQSAASAGGEQSALSFVEQELSAKMQHLRGTVGAGVLTGRSDKMHGLMQQAAQESTPVTPEKLMEQLRSLSTLGPLQGAASVLQPFVQELSAMMEGPLKGWTPQSPPESFAPVAQFAQLLPALLQEMSQIPMDAMAWPSPGLRGGAKNQTMGNITPAVAGQRTGAMSQTKSAAVGAAGPVQGVQKAQAVDGGVKPLTKGKIRDVGSWINRATKKDKDAIAISKDPQAMALATPDQKGRIIKNLIKGHTTDSEDRAMVRILESCTSKAEYDAVLKAAGGAKKVRKELDDKGAKRKFSSIRDHWSKPENAKGAAPKTGPGSNYREQVAAYKQEASKWKFDSKVPAAQGMTAQEAVVKFEQIAKARSDDDAGERIAKDSKAMALATVDDKAAMVRRLIKGHTTDPQDRAMVDILESCTSKEEFDAVMGKAGGKDVVDEIDHGPSKEKMNMLAGAYGRKEWSNNAKQASLAENALVDPAKGADLAGLTGAGAVGELDPSTLPKDPVERDIAIQRHKNRQRSANIHREPRAYKELIFENAKRKASGREPLDWSKANAEVTEAMEKVQPKTRKVTVKRLGGGKKHKLEVPADKASGEALEKFLAEKGFPKDKFKLDKVESGADSRKRHMEPVLEEIRKKYGVGKEEMRDMFTYRQGEINRTGAQELSQNGASTLRSLNEKYQSAVQLHGPESSEARQAKADLDAAKSRLGEEVGRMSETAQSAESLYPTPLSGMDKFVGFFEKWGETILDVLATLLNAIPGVGSALYAGYHGIKFIIKAAQEDVVGALTSVANAVTGVGGAVTGVASAALKGVGAAIHGGLGVANAVESGNPLGVVNALGSVAGGVGNALGQVGGAAEAAGKVLQHTKTGLNAASSGATMIQGLAENNIDQALTGLGGVVNASAGLAGGDAKDVLSGVGQGIQGVNDLVHGRVSAGLGRLQSALDPAVKKIKDSLPAQDQAALQEVQKYLTPGIGLIDGLASGDVSKAADAVLKLGGEAMNQIPQVKDFLNRPDVMKAFDTLQPLSRLATGLAQGDVSAAMEGTKEALLKVTNQPELRKALEWANDIGQVFAAADQKNTRKTLQAIQKSNLLQDFLGGVQSGQFGEGVKALGRDVEQFLQNPQVKELGGWLKSGTEAIQGLVNGDTKGALNLLTQPQSPLANRPEFKPLLDFVNGAQPFLNGVTNGSLDSALGALGSSLPEFLQTPETQTALQNVAPFLGLLSNLHSGRFNEQFGSLINGLQPLTETDAMLAQILPLQQYLGEVIQDTGSIDKMLKKSSVMNPHASGSLNFPIKS